MDKSVKHLDLSCALNAVQVYTLLSLLVDPNRELMKLVHTDDELTVCNYLPHLSSLANAMNIYIEIGEKYLSQKTYT